LNSEDGADRFYRNIGNKSPLITKKYLFVFLSLEDGTHMLSQNVGYKLPLITKIFFVFFNPEDWTTGFPETSVIHYHLLQFFCILGPEDGSDRLSRNIGNKLRLLAP